MEPMAQTGKLRPRGKDQNRFCNVQLCDPIDGSPPGYAFPGILQARTLEWVAFPSPMH